MRDEWIVIEVAGRTDHSASAATSENELSPAGEKGITKVHKILILRGREILMAIALSARRGKS